LEITELPVGLWTQNYKEFLESLIAGTEKKPAILKDYKEYHTDTTVHFVLEFLEGKLAELEKSKDKLEKDLKLSTTITTSNMHLFDEEGRITKYDKPEDILKAFYLLRLQYYEKRKAYLLDKFQKQKEKLDNKVRFLLAVINKEINIHNRKKADLMKELKDKKYTPIYKDGATNEDQGADEDIKSGYDYLLSMPLWNLTMEKVQKLLKERELKDEEINVFMKRSVKEIWTDDINTFIDGYEAWCAEEEQRALNSAGIKKKNSGRRKPNKKAASKRKQESETEDFSPVKPNKSNPSKALKTAQVNDSVVKIDPEDKPSTNKPSTNKPSVSKPSTIGIKRKKMVDQKLDTLLKPEKEKPEKEEPIKAPKLVKPAKSDSEEDEVLSLTERLARKSTSEKDKRRIESLASPPKKTKKEPPAKKKQLVATKQAPVVLSDSDDGLSEPKEEDTKPSKVARTARTARATRKATKYIESDDDGSDKDDDEFNDDE